MTAANTPEKTTPPKRRASRPRRSPVREALDADDILGLTEEILNWADEKNYHLTFIRYHDAKSGEEDRNNLETLYARGWSPVTTDELEPGMIPGSGANPFLTGMAKRGEVDKFIRRGDTILAKINKDDFDRRKLNIQKQAVQQSRQHLNKVREQHMERDRIDGLRTLNESDI